MVEDESEGRIEVEIYPSLQLGGSASQLYDQAQKGVVDLVWTLPGYTPGRFPASEAFELPFMTCTAEGSTRAAWRYFEDNDLDEREFEGVKVIALHTSGNGHIHNNGDPISAKSPNN